MLGFGECKIGQNTQMLGTMFELKVEMQKIQQQVVGVKKHVCVNAIKDIKRLCKEFCFTAGMLKDWLTEGWNKK